jgi:hypothetical protein
VSKKLAVLTDVILMRSNCEIGIEVQFTNNFEAKTRLRMDDS